MSQEKDIREEIVGTLLKSLQERDLKNEDAKNYGEDHIDQLKTACSNLLDKKSFQVGQVVKWKENLKNRKLPYKNQPAIVVAVLDEPIISDEKDAGSPYFLEPLDIVLGVLVDDKSFLTFYYDSRRFETY